MIYITTDKQGIVWIHGNAITLLYSANALFYLANPRYFLKRYVKNDTDKSSRSRIYGYYKN